MIVVKIYLRLEKLKLNDCKRRKFLIRTTEIKNQNGEVTETKEKYVLGTIKYYQVVPEVSTVLIKNIEIILNKLLILQINHEL